MLRINVLKVKQCYLQAEKQVDFYRLVRFSELKQSQNTLYFQPMKEVQFFMH